MPLQPPHTTDQRKVSPVAIQDSLPPADGASSVLVQSEKIGEGMQVGIDGFGAWAIGVGSTIGSYAFLIHGSMIAQAGPLASVLAWLVAAAMSMPLAFLLAELSSLFPSAGGPYVYKYFALKRLIPETGEMFGFLTGWMFWIYVVVSYACMSCGFANLLSNSLFGSSTLSPIWFGPVVITSLFGGATICNLLQVRSASRLNNVFTLLKLATALAFGGLVFFSPHSSVQNVLFAASPAGSTNIWANVVCVLPLAMGGFSGIEMSGCTASETANARRTVPRAILSSVVTVSVVYIGMCIAVAAISHYALSPDKTMAVIPGTGVIATAPALGGYLGGHLCGFLFTAGVILSITSCALSGVMAGARTSLSMARTGLFPKQFARLNPSTRVPDYGLIFQFVFMAGTGIGAHLLSRFGLFPDAYIFLGTAGCVLYGALAMLYGVCLVSLRFTDPDLPRAFKLGNNAVACTVAAISFVVYGFVAFGCTNWSHQLAALFFLLLGVPIYRYYRSGK